jgi:hypothetical protein
MDISREILTYLIPIAMVCAFVHTSYLMIKAYKQQALMDDLTVKEFKRVAIENWKNFGKNSSLFLKPFLVFLLWTLCIIVYFVLARDLGLLRQPTTDMWPRGEVTVSSFPSIPSIPSFDLMTISMMAVVVVLVIGIVLYFRKRTSN